MTDILVQWLDRSGGLHTKHALRDLEDAFVEIEASKDDEEAVWCCIDVEGAKHSQWWRERSGLWREIVGHKQAHELLDLLDVNTLDPAAASLLWKIAYATIKRQHVIIRMLEEKFSLQEQLTQYEAERREAAERARDDLVDATESLHESLEKLGTGLPGILSGLHP